MKCKKSLCAVGMTAMLATAVTLAGCSNNEDVKALTGIKMVSSAISVSVGGTDTLKYEVTPEGAKATSEKWQSPDETVVKVSDKGVITGVAEGSAWVRVTVDDQFTDMCRVTVTPSYPEAPGLPCVQIGDNWWAPVNCGYDAENYPCGKLYQWGRKDGCGYKATDETAAYNDKGDLLQETEFGPIAAAGESASKFYTNAVTFVDWLEPKDDSRWNSGTELVPVKTKHDPCPAGWRVPTFTEMNTLTGNSGYTNLGKGGGDYDNPGYWFNGTKTPSKGSGLYLPASGGRLCFDGTFLNRYSLGGYFSSSVNGDMICGISFTSGYAGLDNGYRANGLSVRCIKISK